VAKFWYRAELNSEIEGSPLRGITQRVTNPSAPIKK
jgi:hypothetical protein